MAKPGEGQAVFIERGVVKSVIPEKRIISVRYLGSDREKEGVIVVTDPGSYSFPSVGDGVLLLDAEPYVYCIGKIEYSYEDKISGPTKAKKVEGGETWIGSVVKRVWFHVANSGNFSLMNGLNDGLKYFAGSRFLRLAGGVINLVGSGAEANFGSVMRDIPGAGKTPIPSDIPTIPSVEGLINLLYNKIKLARFHIGHVMDTTLGVAERSSWGMRLRALIETANATGITASKLAMDEAGNIELASSLAGLMLNAATLIQLGGLGAAEPLIKGTAYIIAENAFLSALQTYCVAIATAGAIHAAIIVPTPVGNAAFITALTTATATFATAVGTFAGALTGTLSVKTMTV